MKKLLVLMLVLITSLASAATLKFDASTGDVTGYIVYYTDGAETWSQDIGNITETNMSIFGLDPGTEYTFHVTAYNALGESGPSNTATYTRPVYAPETNPRPFTLVIPGSPQIIINFGQ